MRRIKLILAAVAAMVALLAATFPGLAMAQDLSSCESVGYDDFGDELYLCGADDVVDDFGEDEEDDLVADEEDGIVNDEEADDLFDDE